MKYHNINLIFTLLKRSVAFMQLPHFREEFIRHLNNKKIRTLKQLAARPEEEIRGIFKNVRYFDSLRKNL